MSEMLIVECDYKDGECLARFEGFNTETSDTVRNKMLEEDYGWLVRDGKHYCPSHKEQAIRE